MIAISIGQRAYARPFPFAAVLSAVSALAQQANVSLTNSAPVAIGARQPYGGTYVLSLDGQQIYQAATAGNDITYSTALPPGTYTLTCQSPLTTQYTFGTATVTANPYLGWVVANAVTHASGSPLQRGCSEVFISIIPEPACLELCFAATSGLEPGSRSRHRVRYLNSCKADGTGQVIHALELASQPSCMGKEERHGGVE